jgi:hypothetical protein
MTYGVASSQRRTSRVRKIFGILEIGKRISIYDTVEAALKGVRKPMAVSRGEDGS